MLTPVVDDELAVDVQPAPIVGRKTDEIAPGLGGRELAAPEDGELITGSSGAGEPKSQ